MRKNNKLAQFPKGKKGQRMDLEELIKRREKSTVLVTLSVSCGSSLNSATAQLKKEYATAFSIKDK